MFTKLAIWYLRKRKKSVLIGYNLKNAEVTPLQSHALTYDNIFCDCEFKTKGGKPYQLMDKVKFDFQVEE